MTLLHAFEDDGLVAETGSTDSFTVVLNSEPTANVTLTLSDNDSSEVLYPSSGLQHRQLVDDPDSDADGGYVMTGIKHVIDVDSKQWRWQLQLSWFGPDRHHNYNGQRQAGFTISELQQMSVERDPVTFTVILNTEPPTSLVDITPDDPGKEACLGSLTSRQAIGRSTRR